MSRTVLLWFRHDLRLADNPALLAAVASGARIVPVFLWSPEEDGDWPPGAAARWWLHQSLQVLSGRLASKGSRLIVRRGPAEEALARLARETGADAVYWNRRYEPAAQAVESALRVALPALGIGVHSFQSAVLVEPWAIQTQGGGPYNVYTPFWRAWLKRAPPGPPAASPDRLEAPDVWPASLALSDLSLLSGHSWNSKLAEVWQPGEASAHALLKRFVGDALSGYATARDLPAVAGTSRLSPALHFGEVSPRQVWAAVGRASAAKGEAGSSWQEGRFVAELAWREFAAHVLYHNPWLPDRPKNAAFERLAWREDPEGLAAWTRGLTGFSLVDAGMRELWQTGWMHNRVRMVVGSLLVKNLLVPWQSGERWFWDTLVDADLASNALNWQWVAGTGPDAAPFFRIFNPESQAAKFDPEGLYRRRWVPEWGTSAYPSPIVDLRMSRERALKAYEETRA